MRVSVINVGRGWSGSASSLGKGASLRLNLSFELRSSNGVVKTKKIEVRKRDHRKLALDSQPHFGFSPQPKQHVKPPPPGLAGASCTCPASRHISQARRLEVVQYASTRVVRPRGTIELTQDSKLPRCTSSHTNYQTILKSHCNIVAV